MSPSRYVHAWLALCGLALVGCAPLQLGEEDASVSASLTGSEVAWASLRALGAKVDGAQTQCQSSGCHEVSPGTIRRWAARYTAQRALLSDDTKSLSDRRLALRRDPLDPSSAFGPERLGLLAAAAHLELSAVNVVAHPIVHAAVAQLQDILGEELAQFRQAVSMPRSTGSNRPLTAAELEVVYDWVGRGMPSLDTLLPSTDQPTTCTDDVTGLAEHVRAMKSAGWAAHNRDAGLPMFACDGAAEPLDCFQQRRGSAEVFPASSIAAEGTTARVLRELGFRTYFWMRSSADGRFVANGYSAVGKSAGVIADLAAALDASGSGRRDIFIDATEDPDFSPDNRGFMFQGAYQGQPQAFFCDQALLERPGTSHITRTEPACSNLGAIGMYQTIGQQVGDNAFSDRQILTSAFINDNAGGSTSEAPPAPGFGKDAAANVRQLISLGTEGGYQLGQHSLLPTPYEGDFIMSRSTALVAGRIAGRNGPLGYSIRKLHTAMDPTGTQMWLEPAGRVCVQGGKAGFSFDERFLTMHRYSTTYDGKTTELSDVYLVDLLTGERQQVTKVRRGQYALYPHFRSDGWLYFLLSERSGGKQTVMASDAALRMLKARP